MITIMAGLTPQFLANEVNIFAKYASYIFYGLVRLTFPLEMKKLECRGR